MSRCGQTFDWYCIYTEQKYGKMQQFQDFQELFKFIYENQLI
jgi:hypothetical protein